MADTLASPIRRLEEQIAPAPRERGERSPLAQRWRAPSWLPVLASTIAGLALATAADDMGRRYAPGAQLFFWLGILVLIGPVATRQLSSALGAPERLALAISCGLALFFVKVLRTPTGFAFHDEIAHWRTLHDITTTHHLFVANPLIPESGSYPGLEIVTGAVAQMSGLGEFASSVVVMSVARVVLVTALFLILQAASGSPRVAGIGSLVYAANPNFLFFDSQFAYESLALALAALLTYLAIRPASPNRVTYGANLLVIAVAGSALAITHHLTSWICALALTGMAAAELMHRRRSSAPPRMLVPAAIVAVAAPLLWFADVGTGAIGYITPHLASGISELVRIAFGNGAPRQLFVSAAVKSPIWEQALGFAAVGLILVGLLATLWFVVRRRLRAAGFSVLLLLACLLYPVTLALRLTSAGEESANRTSEFIYIALGFGLASSAAIALSNPRARAVRTSLLAVALTVIVGGGIVIGWAHWARLPGSYVVSGDPNSLTPSAADTARWVLAYLGPGNRIATDRDNGLELGSPLGEQNVLSALADKVTMVPLITDPTIDGAAQASMRRGHVQYVVTDRRLHSGLPYVGAYVEDGERPWLHPLSSLAATKFDQLLGVDRIYDAGPIQIYALPESGR